MGACVRALQNNLFESEYQLGGNLVIQLRARQFLNLLE